MTARRVLVPVKRSFAQFRRTVNRYRGPRRLVRALQRSESPRIIIGSGGLHLRSDWIETDREFLDLLAPGDWRRFFRPNSIAALLAEHVWEHLTLEQGRAAATQCYTYLRPGGYLRVAVPDGFHPSAQYREWVRPGGRAPMQAANDHRVLYTYQTLEVMLESVGFRVVHYEHFDERGCFHCVPWDPSGGMIRRSSRYDPRNRNGDLAFTSIILDAIKPGG